jgi:type IV pilus assembly protein PilV
MNTKRVPVHSPKPIRRPNLGKRRMAGVMLIEVLVSILIFSFGILGTVALYARAVQYSTNAEDRSRAALLANEIATSMWLRGSVNVGAGALQGDYTAWRARVGNTTTNGFLPGGDGTVTVAGNTATITITWTPSFTTTAQRFVTQVTM